MFPLPFLSSVAARLCPSAGAPSRRRMRSRGVSRGLSHDTPELTYKHKGVRHAQHKNPPGRFNLAIRKGPAWRAAAEPRQDARRQSPASTNHLSAGSTRPNLHFPISPRMGSLTFGAGPCGNPVRLQAQISAIKTTAVSAPSKPPPANTNLCHKSRTNTFTSAAAGAGAVWKTCGYTHKTPIHR